MSVLIWNVRGLNFKERRRDVMDHISMYASSIVGLVETKVKESTAYRVTRCLPHGWASLNNYSHAPKRKNLVLLEPKCMELYSFGFLCTTS